MRLLPVVLLCVRVFYQNEKTTIENAWTIISPRSGVCWSRNVHGRVACMDGRSIIFVRVCHIP